MNNNPHIGSSWDEFCNSYFTEEERNKIAHKVDKISSMIDARESKNITQKEFEKELKKICNE